MTQVLAAAISKFCAETFKIVHGFSFTWKVGVVCIIASTFRSAHGFLKFLCWGQLLNKSPRFQLIFCPKKTNAQRQMKNSSSFTLPTYLLKRPGSCT